MYRDFSTNKALALCHRWQWSSIYFARIIPFADISSPSRLFQKWWLGNRFEGKVERNGVKKRIIFYVPQISFTELVLPLSFSLDISSPNSLIVSLLHVHCPVFLCHPLPHIVPYVYSYILVRTYPSSLIPTHSLSLSHSGEKYILHLSSSLKFSLACIYIRLFAIPPIFSPSLVPSKRRFPGTRGLLRMLLLVRRNTNSGSQIYRFLIS